MTQTNDGGATDLTTDALKRLAASITPGEWDCEVLTATDEIGDEWATDVEVGSVSGAPIHAHDLGYSDDTDRRIIANARAIALVPALLRELIERREADGWQPIETAPKDGRAFMVYVATSDVGPYIFAPVSRDMSGGWWDGCTGDQIEPIAGATHWRPLPEPPTTEGGQQ